MEYVAVFFACCVWFYAAFISRNAWFFARQGCPPATPPRPRPLVTVVVPARNEAEHVAQCLTAILAQDYPRDLLEVILVNDHSTDATREIALVRALKDHRLRVLDLPEEVSQAHKKAALTLGIEAAQGEIILQTDADCVMGPHWVSRMVDHFGADTALVSGPVRLRAQPHWLEEIQALESMGLVAIGAGSLAAGAPNMANGANMAYRREAFLAVDGFAGTESVASGDDELLLQKIARLKGRKLRFAKCRDAIVETRALSDWGRLKAQRLRWVSKARAYLNRRVNVVQVIAYLAFLAYPVVLGLAIWNPAYWLLLAELLVLKWVSDLLLMYQAAKFFHTFPLLKRLPLLELLYTPYVLWVGLAGNLVKHYSWKGRTVS
ncbi:MAG: glycosyltransferase [Bacteroidetes bacterium]|nr:MAG: glycosyltransferase [Bacteroidota bacterium]